MGVVVLWILIELVVVGVVLKRSLRSLVWLVLMRLVMLRILLVWSLREMLDGFDVLVILWSEMIMLLVVWSVCG